MQTLCSYVCHRAFHADTLVYVNRKIVCRIKVQSAPKFSWHIQAPRFYIGVSGSFRKKTRRDLRKSVSFVSNCTSSPRHSRWTFSIFWELKRYFFHCLGYAVNDYSMVVYRDGDYAGWPCWRQERNNGVSRLCSGRSDVMGLTIQRGKNKAIAGQLLVFSTGNRQECSIGSSYFHIWSILLIRL